MALHLLSDVNDNKIIFSTNNRVLIKLLKQETRYGAKQFSVEFSSKCGHWKN